MEADYRLDQITPSPSAAATQNACKLCAPLGAALVFKGIAGTVPLLHGSQGCSTYIRRYLISHFKEPMDIACSNFGEQTAIFGGGANMKLALDNIILQYHPEMIGVATTCLAETIGDDVPMYIHEYRKAHSDRKLPPIVHVSTPSYQGTHMQGFHNAVLATVATLSQRGRTATPGNRINLFPGMLSPADLRHLKTIVAEFGLQTMVLPDYSQTLDGPLWSSYHRIPKGGTTVEAISGAGTARASIELGHVLSGQSQTAAVHLETQFGVQALRLGMPLGIRQTDQFMQSLEAISGNPTPLRHMEARGRLLDALVNGHKYVNGARAVLYGEADLVAGMAGFLAEIGLIPVICATGDDSGRLKGILATLFDEKRMADIQVMEGVDFVDIEEMARRQRPDLIIGHSKGYSLARKLKIPLVRIGFPVHDRVGGSRLMHVGYRGTLEIFDRLANAILQHRQGRSEVGYTYM